MNLNKPSDLKATAKKADAKEMEAPKDEVTISKPKKKSFGQKLIEFPGKVVKGIAGAAVGVVSSPLHVLPGAAKGMYEGVTKDKDENMAPFHITMFAQNVGIAATAGFMLGGPLTAGLAAGGALLFTGLTTWMGHKTEVYDKLSQKIENKVDNALQDNQGSKTETAFQNATEGLIIGGAVSGKSGFSVGYDSGSGAVSGGVDVVEGIMEGVYQTGKNAVNKARGK